jgi:phosphatidylglycerophosphate synthase
MTAVLTVPNLVTAVRTVAAVVLATLAIASASAGLAAAAFLVYWVGDVLDGLSARILGQETRFGAVLDILADRACCSLCVAALLVLRPDMALPLSVFLLSFMVLDCQLSLATLRWPILGPSYFGAVHPGLYRWNWSPLAKTVNTAALVLLVLVAPSPLPPLLLALGVTAVKAVSLVAIGRLAVPVAAPVG